MSAVATQDLVLLGLLKERPLHGYELKQIVEERLQQVAHIAPGTIYYTLKKLEKAGLVERSYEREGNRPERQVFSLTPAGADAFQQMLREALFLDERAYYVFDAALYFFPYVNPEELEQAIDQRLQRIVAFRQHIEQMSQSFPGRWPFQFHALRRKGELLTAALEEWYRELRTDLTRRRAKRKRKGSSPSGSTRFHASPSATSSSEESTPDKPKAIPA